MRDDIPIPGSTRAKLIAAGIRQFSQYSYDEVDVDSVAAEAGVTTGSLYHHFQSKKAFYGVLRDDMTRRILDRMEAASESVAPEQAIKAALLAAYDGVLRIKAGKLFTEPDLRGENVVEWQCARYRYPWRLACGGFKSSSHSGTGRAYRSQGSVKGAA